MDAILKDSILDGENKGDIVEEEKSQVQVLQVHQAHQAQVKKKLVKNQKKNLLIQKAQDIINIMERSLMKKIIIKEDNTDIIDKVQIKT